MDTRNPETILSLLDRCPPFLVYYGAHLITGEHTTVNVLAERTQLCVRTILRMAYSTTWDNISVGVIDRFCAACGVDPMNPDNLLAAVREEIKQPLPFPQFPPARRKVMLARFNRLGAEVAMRKAA